MLCEVCHIQVATIHKTKIVGDVATMQNLCADCFDFAEPAESQEFSEVFLAGCHYCGENSQCTCPDLTGGGEKRWALCADCAQEFYQFVGLKLPGFYKGKIEPEQVSQVPKILAELDRHMREWVSKRDSR